MHYTIFVLYCAYHVHNKMSHRCSLVFLRNPWNTMDGGIIMWFWFWNIIWLCVFTLSPNLHTFCIWCTHTQTLWHVWVLNATILSCIDELCLYMSILGELRFKFLFLKLYFNVHCAGPNLLLIKFAALCISSCSLIWLDTAW